MWRARHNLSFLLFLSLFTSPVFANDSDWPLANLDLTNSRDASNQTDVNKNNVDSLIMDWSYTTLPDSAILQGLTGSISSTPSVSDGKVFFTDWSGNITALNQKTGAVIWKKSFISDISIPNMSMNLSRNTPRDANGMTALGLRGSLHHEKDGDPGSERPGPGNFLPFPAPQHFYGPAGAEYAGFVPDVMVGPISGPKSLWTLVNPPGDVIPDYVNVIPGNNNTLKTIAGMVTALDAKTGEIIWQRPAIDAIAGQIKPSMAYGSITVANGVVFAGYGDQQGTLVALDAKTGKKLFQFNGKMTIGPNQEVNFGLLETAPAIVGNQVFIGIGGGTAGPLAAGNAGNKLYVLKLNKK
jgi:outer membrane protein assembly factor BamB